MAWNCFLRNLPQLPQQVAVELRSGLQRLAALAPDAPPDERASILGRIGEYYRQLGMLDQAVSYLERAHEVALAAKAQSLAVTMALRLATARQHRGEHPRAEALALLVAAQPLL
ncbi:hypothetical protein D3C86_1366980 [compost metagenome]